MSGRGLRTAVFALALVSRAQPASAENPGTYRVGNIPVAGAVATVEFPLGRSLAGEVDLSALGQGTYESQNPFSYLSLMSPGLWIHYDRVRNARFSLGFQEALYGEIPALGLKSSHEERVLARARLQQPRGEAALYELAQLDVRSFTDPTGTHRVVYRPRFRVGQGFNLDAARINSLMLYEEVALQFAQDGYATRAFNYFRAFAGYTWTTRRGTFLTLGVVGQVTLNPAATRYDVFWGPVLSLAHRFRAQPPEGPPQPAEVEVQ
jgi:hypothetical protein